MKKYIKSSGNYPDFKKIAEAQRFLDSQDPDKVKLVEECYEAVLDLYAVPGNVVDYYDVDYSIGARESSVINEFAAISAEEWSELSVEEAATLFDKIFEAIEITRADEAAAWC